MTEIIYQELRDRFQEQCRQHDLMDRDVEIKARALTTAEAIGDPEADDFPLQQGKERLMQADFMGAVGQAFSDRYGDYQGTLRNILNMSLTNNYRRALFVATINAVTRYLEQTGQTIHCHDQEPEACAGELAEYIRQTYGEVRITQIGFQPTMVERLAADFSYRVLDLDPDNIGQHKRGALVEGPEALQEAIDQADLLLVTGTTLVNGTIGSFLVPGKPVIFYGTTIAGAAALMGWQRFCAKAK